MRTFKVFNIHKIYISLMTPIISLLTHLIQKIIIFFRNQRIIVRIIKLLQFTNDKAKILILQRIKIIKNITTMHQRIDPF